jgi:hypothetical protein
MRPVSDLETSDRPPVEQPPSKAPGDRSAPPDIDPVTEVRALAELLPEVVVLAGQRAVYPGRWAHIAKLAMEYASVRAALVATGDAS